MHTLSLTPKRVNIIIRATALTSEKMNALDLFNFKKKEVTEEGLWHWCAQSDYLSLTPYFLSHNPCHLPFNQCQVG